MVIASHVGEHVERVVVRPGVGPEAAQVAAAQAQQPAARRQARCRRAAVHAPRRQRSADHAEFLIDIRPIT